MKRRTPGERGKTKRSDGRFIANDLLEYIWASASCVISVRSARRLGNGLDFRRSPCVSQKPVINFESSPNAEISLNGKLSLVSLGAVNVRLH